MNNPERATRMRSTLTRIHDHQAAATSETCIHCARCGQPWPCETRRGFDGTGGAA